MKKQKWTIAPVDKKINTGVYVIDAGKVESGSTFSLFAMSDFHVDSPKHHSRVAKKHLEMAREINAPILMYGDFFDAKEGRFDFRATRNKRGEVNEPDTSYINQLINYGADKLEPYAEQIAVLGQGNHETALSKMMDVDILSLMSRELGARGTRSPIIGGYTGWIVVRYKRSGGQGSVPIYFHHGVGGGAQVTRGAIKAHRRATFIEGAEFVLSGHIHTPDYSHYRSKYLNAANRVSFRDTVHLVTPGYQRSDIHTGVGWEVQKEFPPMPVGCARIDITFHEDGKGERRRKGLGRKQHTAAWQLLLE